MRPLVPSIVAAGLLASGTALAQVPSVDARLFHPSTDPAGSLYLEPTTTPGPGAWNAGAIFSYALRPAVVRDGAGTVVGRLVQHQLSWDTIASLGIGQRLSLGFDLPTILWQTGEVNAYTARITGDSSLPPQALGDLALTAKGNVVTPGDLGGFGLGAIARATLPTGDRTSYVGEGAVTSELRLLAEYRLIAVSLQGTAGYDLRTEDRDIGHRTFGDAIPWGGAVVVRPQAFGLDDKGRWTWIGEIHGAKMLGPSSDAADRGQFAAASPVLAGLSARYAIRDVSFLAGAETSLSQALGAPPLRLVAGVQWAPRAHDKDRDGIEDDVDQCPELAEDKDGFEDDDGCPEWDVDDDGVGDTEDKCPTVKEDADGFQDEDGCPDPDNDSDGILDSADACPDAAGPASQDPAKNGCPPRDRDRDGIVDEDDRCPDQAEDKDGFQDDDGCPDPDDDGDGVPDAEDACPRKAGEASSDPKANGCPFADRDGDGIADDADKCPDAAETWNGAKDDDGCPEPFPPPLATLPKDAKPGATVKLAKPVKLTDAGAIDPVSAPVVRALATLAQAAPGRSFTVAARPAKDDEGGKRADARAAAVAQAIGAAAHRKGAASPAPWASLPKGAQKGDLAIVLAEPAKNP